jgi:methionyl-tRNA formyltransferase
VRIAVAASPEVAIPALVGLRDSAHTLIRVISQPDKPAGRGKVLTPTAVSQWAIDEGIDLVRPVDFQSIAAAIQDCDCVVTIGYGRLLPPEILSIPRHGFLNLHFSLLPRWRGAAPVQRAIEANDALTGVTVFQLDEGMDTGPIYTVHRFALDQDISSDELLAELGDLGVSAILETIEMIEKGIRPKPQNSEGATRANKLSHAEGEIDWNEKAENVSAKIRAFTSNPGAWTNFRGSILKIASPAISSHIFKPGEISIIEKKLYVGTASSALEILTITPSGKQAMTATSWANGARLHPGDSFE